MRLELSRKGDYSVRAMLHLARRSGERQTARRIAAEMQIPYKFLTQILAGLVGAGLLDPRAGPAGGYLLARPAESITLLEIIEATEGPIGADRCVLGGAACPWDSVCPVHDTWSRAQRALAAELAAVTLSDLARIDTEIAAGRYRPEFPEHAR